MWGPVLTLRRDIPAKLESCTKVSDRQSPSQRKAIQRNGAIPLEYPLLPKYPSVPEYLQDTGLSQASKYNSMVRRIWMRQTHSH
jgi:hypothetical protein